MKKIFLDYIRDFLKIKVECSGWPASCDTDEKKTEYIDKYQQLYGVKLNRDTLDRGVNEGNRYIAKQFLNSMWG